MKQDKKMDRRFELIEEFQKELARTCLVFLEANLETDKRELTACVMVGLTSFLVESSLESGMKPEQLKEGVEVTIALHMLGEALGK